MTKGTIETAKIQATHEKIKQLVNTYHTMNVRVGEITATVKENWVGKGLNEFETQYNLLIKKIEDFGDTLTEIYDALVMAQGEYDTADDSMRQQFVMATNEMNG